MIFYIDFASSGDASFYSSQWSEAFKKSDVKYLGFINVDSLIINPKFRKTVLSAHFSQSKIWLAMVLLSHVLNLMALTLVGMFLRPRIIFNLHQPFAYWSLFSSIWQGLGLKVYPVVHDIQAFDTSSYPKLIISDNHSILKRATSVLVHQGYERFAQFYPSISYDFLPFPRRNAYKPQPSLIDGPYLYLPGKYRKEKGFHFVIKHWPVHCNFKLVISSEVPNELMPILEANPKIEYHPDKTEYKAFQSLVSNCSGAILMYTVGTNSGILETMVANEKPCLVSKIPMFLNHEVGPELTYSDLDAAVFKKALAEFEVLAGQMETFRYENRQENLSLYSGLIKKIGC